MKERMRGHRFSSLEEISAAVTRAAEEISAAVIQSTTFVHP